MKQGVGAWGCGQVCRHQCWYVPGEVLLPWMPSGLAQWPEVYNRGIKGAMGVSAC